MSCTPGFDLRFSPYCCTCLRIPQSLVLCKVNRSTSFRHSGTSCSSLLTNGVLHVCPCPSFIAGLQRAGVGMLSEMPSLTCPIKGENNFFHCKTALLRWNPGPPGVTGKKSCACHPTSDSGCHSFCFKFSLPLFLPSFLPLFFFPPACLYNFQLCVFLRPAGT